MDTDLANWSARPRPARHRLEGRTVRLEPLSAAAHGDGLFAASSVADADERFRWLAEYPPHDRADLQAWLEKAETSTDPLFYTVIDQQSSMIGGRQALMRIDPANGSIEAGNIYWGPGFSRTVRATEALYLFARHVFDDLGYRRFEWKCNNRNGPSRRAALRFGFTFEGVFRQHMVVKGENRDTAWFSMLDGEWPALKSAFDAWLDPANFDNDGNQKRRLEEFTGAARPFGRAKDAANS
ncbi:GNAT family N-acetyltransferase [Nitratireductor sp. ZSWI3]|uniref:GNAT family N-acetyltransferase n=1 Tax=Nitratireductor sp. ZSWI3 TaxID=2966359 RepID=UPI00214F9B6B|nr:GNAT family protein [Nitratireductor sp. ZSWI3]MCR4265000.1 GNAT family N-acetyltransferase [Nitratireductor sp. ZSWI3]